MPIHTGWEKRLAKYPDSPLVRIHPKADHSMHCHGESCLYLIENEAELNFNTVLGGHAFDLAVKTLLRTLVSFNRGPGFKSWLPA